MKVTDEAPDLLRLIYNELRNVRVEQKSTNERLMSIEKSVHADVIRREVHDTTAEFQDDETAIINYVRNNPGQNKRKIVQVFEKGGYNRITRSPKVTFKKINELKEKYDIFKFQADRQHKQRQCVYINDNSLLLHLESTLLEFRESIVAAIEAYPIKWTTVDEIDNNPEKIGKALLYYGAIFASYQQFVSMIILHAIFDWPNIAKNPTILKRAYQILFSKLIEILQSVKDSFDKLHVSCRGNLAYISWAMRPGIMYSGVVIAQDQNILPQLEKLFDVAWSVSQDHFPYAQIFFDPVLEDENYVDSNTVSRSSEWRSAEVAPESWKKPLNEWAEQRRSQKLQNNKRKDVSNPMPIRRLIVEKKSMNNGIRDDNNSDHSHS
jgi:hypothetical protein